MGTSKGTKEHCATGGEVVFYGRVSGMPLQRELGRGPGPTGEARRHCWGGQEQEGWTAIGISLRRHFQLSEGSMPLVRDTGVEKPLVGAKADREILVQATGVQTSLVWAKGSRGLCEKWCL